MSLLSWASHLWENDDSTLGLQVEPPAQLRFGHEFVVAIGKHIKALISAFDVQVKAHVKAHSLTKISDVSWFS
jgi:hypothetical protein